MGTLHRNAPQRNVYKRYHTYVCYPKRCLYLPTTAVPWGAVIYFAGVTAPSVTVKQGPNTISTPFITYQELGLTGDPPATGPTSGTIYEVRGTAVIVTSSGGSPSINIYDQLNNLLVSAAPSLTNVRLEPGFRIIFTWSGSAPTVVVAVAPS